MLVVGIHSVEAFLEKRQAEIIEIIVEASKKDNLRIQSLLEKSSSIGVRVKIVSDLKESGAQGVAAKVQLSWEGMNWCEWLQKNPQKNIVMLDGVQDPHNLGACMRTACALGAGAIIIPNRRAAPLNSTALKVACGAGAWLPVFAVNNLASCLKIFKDMGYWVIACSEHARNELRPNEFSDKKKLLIMGNEQKGVRSSIIQQSDYLLKLPTPGPIKSLNVSVALGVALNILGPLL